MTLSDLLYQATRIQNQVASSYIPLFLNGKKVSIEQAKQIVDIADSIIDIYKTQVDALKTFTQMDNVASQGQLMVGMGIISQEEKTLIG